MTTQLPITATATTQSTPRPREIDGVYRAPGVHWVGDGFRVLGYFSRIPDVVRKLSPFLLLDYHPRHVYAPSARPRGVGVHPHRGFETVTLAWEGSVAHHDSAGGGGVIGPGDAQWMTAASGVLHKEYHEENFSRAGGAFHMAQLWVNLPRAHKMDPPRYQGIEAGEMGSVTLPDGAGSVRVVAGDFHGVRGPALTFTPVTVLDVDLTEGAQLDVPIPARHNAAILVMKGSGDVNGVPIVEHDLLVFARGGEQIRVEAHEGTKLLVLAGEPIDEPIVQYGPFVMNTDREIDQAIVDFEAGKFGHLDD